MTDQATGCQQACDEKRMAEHDDASNHPNKVLKMTRAVTLKLLRTINSVDAGYAAAFVKRLDESDVRFQEEHAGEDAVTGYWLFEAKAAMEKGMTAPGVGGSSAPVGSSTSGPAALVTHADLQQLRSELEFRHMQQPGQLMPGSATYSRAFNERSYNKRQRLESFKSESTAPPFPSQTFSIVDTGENTILLPRVRDILGALPGAVQTKLQGMDAVLYEGIAFVETYKRMYLAGAAPDITILQQGYGVHASAALAVIELQTGLLDNHHRGKLMCYLGALLDATPGRALAKGALFNGRDLELFQAETASGSSGYELKISSPRVLVTDDSNNEDVWKELWTFLLSGGAQHTGLDEEAKLDRQYGWRLPSLYAQANSSDRRLRLKGLLGSSRDVYVWEAQHGASDTAVCKQYCGDKRLSSYNREKTALEAIGDAPRDANQAQGRRVWPRLLSANDQQKLLLTQPVVEQMAYLTTSTLKQLFAGIRFLHNVAKLVHRDLEDKHVGLAGSDLFVFDLSTCVPLNTPAERGYSGTVINASDDVLTGLRSDGGAAVVVQRQQDVVALVKTVFALTHPHRRPAIHAAARQVAEDLEQATDDAARSAAVDKVRNFWALEFNVAEPCGLRWQGLVDLAHVDSRPGQPYEDVMSKLESKLLKHACCR